MTAKKPADYIIEEPTFLRSKHELEGLLEKLGKASDAAVKFLKDVVEDVEQSPKMRMECASKIIAYQMEASKEINTDNIQRLVAEIKVKQLGAPAGGKLIPNRAVVDFSKIQDV